MVSLYEQFMAAGQVKSLLTGREYPSVQQPPKKNRDGIRFRPRNQRRKTFQLSIQPLFNGSRMRGQPLGFGKQNGGLTDFVQRFRGASQNR